MSQPVTPPRGPHDRIGDPTERPSQRPILISLPEQEFGQSRASDWIHATSARHFLRMFEVQGVPVCIVRHPEQFKSGHYAQLLGLEAGEHVHLSFRDPEDVRPIPGAYNIAYVAAGMERREFGDSTGGLLPLDPARLLKACHEVWTHSAQAEQALLRRGMESVHVVPTPVAPPKNVPPRAGLGELAYRAAMPLISSSASNAVEAHRSPTPRGPLGEQFGMRGTPGRRRQFLTLSDPRDEAQNLAALIEGFLIAMQKDEDAILLVRLTQGSVETLSDLSALIAHLFGEPHCLQEDRVLFLSGAFSDADVSQLYFSSDFYISAATGDEQNVAIMEAIAHSCLPILPRSSGLADSFNAENSIIIDTGQYEGLFTELPFGKSAGDPDFFCDRFQIAQAIRAALELAPQERASKSSAARQMLAAHVSDDRVFARVSERIKDARPSLDPRTEPPKRWWRG